MTTQTVPDEQVAATQHLFIEGATYNMNWTDTLHARVDITLDASDPMFYGPQDEILRGCLVYPPAGYAIANPSSLVILYDHDGNDQKHQSDLLADAGRRATATIKGGSNRSVRAMGHHKWDSQQFAAVEIILANAAQVTQVDFKFTPFPRPQEITPATIVPSKILAGSNALQAAGFFVTKPKTLVYLYDRTQVDEVMLANAADLLCNEIVKVCTTASMHYRVEKYTRKIVPR